MDSHCRRKGCDCTHDEGCYRGWIDAPDGSSTLPCFICRPQTHERVHGRLTYL